MGNQLLYLFAILAVVVGFLAIIYYDEQAQSLQFSGDARDYLDEAEKLTVKYPDGSEFSFAKDPQPPVTEFVYNKVIKTVPVVDEDGNPVIDEETGEQQTEEVEELEKVEVSRASVEITDKIKSQSKKCQQGYVCIIEGDFRLVDVFGNDVSPPYSFLITVVCDRSDCNLTPTPKNLVTDGGGGFKYCWTTTKDNTAGEYQVVLNAWSSDKDSYGQYTEYLHTMDLNLYNATQLGLSGAFTGGVCN